MGKLSITNALKRQKELIKKWVEKDKPITTDPNVVMTNPEPFKNEQIYLSNEKT
jgi:hypothetical protein